MGLTITTAAASWAGTATGLCIGRYLPGRSEGRRGGPRAFLVSMEMRRRTASLLPGGRSTVTCRGVEGGLSPRQGRQQETEHGEKYGGVPHETPAAQPPVLQNA